jgi:hypothetical protein
MGGNNVQEQMERLRALQGLDHELNRIRQQQHKLEQEQDQLAGEQERVQAMVDSLAGDVGELRAQQDELRQAMTREEEIMQRSEGRLSEIKTQKEYLAVVKEIDTAKKMIKDLEEQVRTKENEVVALNQEKEEKETLLTELGTGSGQRKEEIEQELQDFEKAVAEKNDQRASHLKPLPAPLRKRYHLLMERRDGVAVVEARDGNCTGCHMHLPPQLFNSLFLDPEIKSCPHCNRLLFVLKNED